ncbi:hypothetical protein ARMGADRAFT_1032955 [Armillaria gallica]|uniref:Uncharacterized protein n=1 Tax=Armillaria gallica TaxID=47427 RepID=A0A2H3D3P0_ARMGA|nr:hypothetical protein ARMGADRAFT_1032955 [Armillaria gallica]
MPPAACQVMPTASKLSVKLASKPKPPQCPIVKPTQVLPAKIFKGARRDIGEAGEEDDVEDKEDEDEDEKVALVELLYEILTTNLVDIILIHRCSAYAACQPQYMLSSKDTCCRTDGTFHMVIFYNVIVDLFEKYSNNSWANIRHEDGHTWKDLHPANSSIQTVANAYEACAKCCTGAANTAFLAPIVVDAKENGNESTLMFPAALMIMMTLDYFETLVISTITVDPAWYNHEG